MENKCWYINSSCNAIAPNRYELENDIVDLEVLPPVTCGGLNLVRRTTKTAKSAGGCIHFLDFDLGFEYIEKMLDIIPAKLDLLGLAEIQHILDNCNQLVYWWGEWEFRWSRNPVFYEWMELPVDSDVWERLYKGKKNSTMFAVCFNMLEFNDV